MKRCSKIIVRGTVQGVLYRDYVKERAAKYHIEGTVQNSNDGAVVINACGTKDDFESFIDALYQGSPKSTVEEILEEPMGNSKDFRGVFRIIGIN